MEKVLLLTHYTEYDIDKNDRVRKLIHSILIIVYLLN